jgi:phosphonate transport system substrate-binding protein
LKDSEQKLVPLAAEVRNGQASYRSVIVVRGDSPIGSVEDLAGNTLALGSPQSFSSHFVPRVLLGNAGVSLGDLRDYSYLGRHERVALAVLHGDFDAGGMNRDVALRYRDRQPGLRILATSPPLPPHLLVARPGLSGEKLDTLQRALLDQRPEDNAAYRSAVAALGSGIGFAAVELAPFKRARRIVEAVESQPVALPAW